ncbi:MAG TPA: YciI family protein [Acidimicrobiia bacterium]|nr:YciI family protein [Acidimicrobiia bacterium]
MKYMLIMRATDEAHEAFADLDFTEVMNTMGKFNDELIRAGVLLAAEGLDPDPAQGVVVDFTAEKPVVTDGPYGETKELFGGYYILDVASLDDAVAWAKKMPMTAGSKIEIRRVTTIDEFPQDNEWVEKERAWRESTGQL